MSVVDEIKERLDVVEVISAYVPLRKAGRTYKGLCPFHQEKTPSFVVFPESGTWRCFGACGVGGDIFSFVMKRENLDFREALEALARKAGVDLAPPSAARSHHEEYLDRLREINNVAALYFHNLLRNASQAQVARDYLAQRGLDETTIAAFQIGYALDSWDALASHLQARNYAVADLLAAGLVVRKDHDDDRVSHYDRFRHRVMVPIRDVQGRVIGFGARALAGDQQPKYLNTPQTPLFDKSSVVFGLDKARQAIRARGQAIIVEGYMDVLAAHQYGETNVVASMGTALTEQQLRQLQRYTDTFVLALDADTAGQAATLRGIDQARQALDREWAPVLTATGLLRHEARLAAHLRIMTLPAGQDPDDVIRSDLALWRQLASAALAVVDYFFDLVRRDLDLSTAQGKSDAAERLAPLIHEVADDVQRAHYVQQLARMIQTDERTVERLVLRHAPKVQPAAESPAMAWDRTAAEDWEHAPIGKPPAQQMAALRPAVALRPSPAVHSLALLLMYPSLLPQLQGELVALGASPLDEDDFDRVETRAVCAALLAGAVREDGLWPEAPVALQQVVAELRSYGQRWPALPRQQALKDLVDSVLRLRVTALNARTRQLPALVRDAEAQGQWQEARTFRQALQDWSQQRFVLEQTLNARTLAGQRQAASNASM